MQVFRQVISLERADDLHQIQKVNNLDKKIPCRTHSNHRISQIHMCLWCCIPVLILGTAPRLSSGKDFSFAAGMSFQVDKKTLRSKHDDVN